MSKHITLDRSIRSWSWARDDDEVEAKLIVVGIEQG